MIQCLYIIKSDGEPLYGKSLEEVSCIDMHSLPHYVKNSVALFHSRSSTSSEKVYTLQHDESLWAYAFFNSFALVALAPTKQNLVNLKYMLLSIGRKIAHEYGAIIQSWNSDMSDLMIVEEIIDRYTSIDLTPMSPETLEKIDALIDSALERPEIAFVGIFDSRGKMVRGNVPEIHLFRIEVEISQGVIKPVIDIVPTSIVSGDNKVQMLRVNSLTVAAASLSTESTLNAISTVSEIAHTLNDLV
ncbi:hypothetical protein EU527_05280 [Candidatus Thorarchaeota archaeon]|nr:MAG: hypothetical protein EU527_05280 [Candidatus Thorarchaeota archaeon]